MCGHELGLCIQKLGREDWIEGVAAEREKTKIPSVFPVRLFYFKLAFPDDNKC